ncbi:alpha-amylase family glycosyl hydrolase [Streptomyces sp. NPDC005336]|uniref:glycoside hydrolase family 13 protein n=1 Tax=Streptomyces sp. NPDC005336 TaxID=3157035 RepID=UPI0033B9C8DD
MSWWRHAVCYEIHPRSFADSNGDGIGDLPGVTAHLDHLRHLGVDALWLTPCYPSPLADGGYDIADHAAIAPDLGTLDDFDTLTRRAHTLGMRLIIDLVPNHTSDTHPWFREALGSAPDSASRDRYVFRPGKGPDGTLPPNDWQSAFGGPAWTRVSDGDWYLHLHAPQQPDLNWRNSEVRSAFTDVLRFWLGHGTDGFRVDVAHALFKAEGLPDAGPGQHQDPLRNHLMPYYDQEELHPLYRDWRTLLNTHPARPDACSPDDRVLVAECAVFAPERLARYVRPDEMHQTFNFAFLEAPWQARALRQVIDGSLATSGSVDAPVTWVLSSHDAIRPVTRFGSELRARSATLLMLALPGAVYLYQGEELALPQAHIPDDRIRDPLWERSGHTDRGRDGARSPIPWSGSAPPYSFTAASPDQCWLPQPPDWADHCVDAQRGDPRSCLALYRQALRLRRKYPATAQAPLRWHSAPHAPYLAFQRGALACVVNLGPDPLPLATLGLPGHPVLSSTPLTGDTLPPDAAVWLVTESGHRP